MISHFDKCIFFHIPKVAGQSIETFFLRRNGLSWEERAPLLLRPKTALDPAEAPSRLAHLRGIDYVSLKYISEELFNKYFKFAFVRNPYSRAVSFYRYLGFHHWCSFEHFACVELEKTWKSPHKGYFVSPQWTFLYPEETSITESDCLADYVGRFENLDKDFSFVLKNIRIPKQPLPYVNESNDQANTIRQKAKGLLFRFLKGNFFHRVENFTFWKNFYTDNAQKEIFNFYRADFEIFGYEEIL